MNNGKAIEVQNLRRYFGDVKAVDGVSFDVQQGEIFSLLGPNGAGKTTAISVICCLLQPTEGDVLVLGHSIRRDPSPFLNPCRSEMSIASEVLITIHLVFDDHVKAVVGPMILSTENRLLPISVSYNTISGRQDRLEVQGEIVPVVPVVAILTSYTGIGQVRPFFAVIADEHLVCVKVGEVVIEERRDRRLAIIRLVEKTRMGLLRLGLAPQQKEQQS
jgi:ABC-type cobalamin/Fe3+-siderophores transport system ATPase subunit